MGIACGQLMSFRLTQVRSMSIMPTYSMEKGKKYVCYLGSEMLSQQKLMTSHLTTQAVSLGEVPCSVHSPV